MRKSFTRAPGMTAPVRSATLPLMVPVEVGAGPWSWAVALGGLEGSGDCARAGKEQSRRTQSKRNRGPAPGKQPETNPERFRPKDFPQQPFLAKFTVSLPLQYIGTLTPDKALTH